MVSINLNEIKHDTKAICRRCCKQNPHVSVIGEVCDLVYNKVKSLEGEEKAYMAADYFMKLANQKFHK